jgi:plasmid stabilization system protein ParE
LSIPIVLTAEAEADLDEAAQWYEQRSAGLGVNPVAQVGKTLDRIANHPDLCSKVHNDIRWAAVRRFPYGVFYRRGSNRVEVIAEMHNRRHPSIWRSR